MLLNAVMFSNDIKDAVSFVFPDFLFPIHFGVGAGRGLLGMIVLYLSSIYCHCTMLDTIPTGSPKSVRT